MKPSEKEFVKFVKAQCKKYDVTCKLVKAPSVFTNDEGISECSGYFDGDNRQLVCAIGVNPEWIGILAHEYCHLTQWVEDAPIWKKSEKHNTYTLVNSWLSGEPVRNIKFHLGVCRDLELDNEKRTVNVIKKFGLDVNLDEYIQKSNAYVHYYNYMYYNRKWCTPTNSPHRVADVWKAMPKRFNMKYEGMSNRIKRVYDSVYL